MSLPFERDEGMYAYIAWRVTSHGEYPYLDIFDNKPPIIYLIYSLPMLLGYFEPVYFRLISTVAILSTSVIIFLIGKKSTRASVGLLAQYIFLVMLLHPSFSSYATNTEVILLVPLMLLIYLHLKWPSHSRALWYFGGSLAGLSLLTKQISIAPILVVLVFASLKLYKYSSIKRVVEYCFRYLIGFVLVLLVVSSILEIHRYLPDFIEQTFFYPRIYASKMISIYGISAFLDRSAIIFRAFPFVMLVFFSTLFSSIPRKKFIVLTFISLFFSTVPSPFGHYYIPLIPFIALLASLSIFSISSLLLRRSLVFLIIISTLIFLTHIDFFDNKDLFFWAYERQDNPFYESLTVAEHVKEITSSSDFVYVAGAEPQILYYAKRKSSTRHLFDIQVNLVEKYQDETIKQLKKNSPQFIVYPIYRKPDIWNAVENKVDKYLEELLEIDYHLSAAYNVEEESLVVRNISNEIIDGSSILIYEKNMAI